LRGLPLQATIPIVNPPPTSYAWNDGTALAYQVVGASSGPDLLFVPGSVTHLEVLWQEPSVSRFLTRLAGFSRLILMDPRGLGLSDRLTDVPTLDERVADVIAVLDAAGSDRAALFGNADTGPPAIATAVSHPERVTSLILCGTYAKARWSDDYPIGWTDEEWSDFRRTVRDGWGKEEDSLRNVAPSRVDDDEFGRWWATLMRLGASPRAVLLLGEMAVIKLAEPRRRPKLERTMTAGLGFDPPARKCVVANRNDDTGRDFKWSK
jgi:pimeloyl-ACP methyl ester carboxylesterase